MTLNIMIKDTGIGMEKKDLGKIFDRFSRLSPTYETGQSSSGLGLTIVQQLLLQMHGTISVESEVGQGTTFHCSIPMKFIAPPKEQKPSYIVDKVTPKPNKQTLNILVVEDSKPVQRAMQMLMKHVGATISFADNGEQAINTDITPFDIVFMDLGLGDMTGIEVTHILREKYDSDIPIVALTAHAREDDKAKCLEAGMKDFITKPILLDSLKNCLKSLDLY